MLTELDHLLQVQDKVNVRAAQVAHQRKEELSAGRGGYVAHTVDEYVYMKNRRVQQRVALAVDLGLRSGNNFYVGFSENINKGGIYVSTYEALPKGEQLMVELSLPDGGAPIHSLMEVAWVRDYIGGEDHDAVVPPGMGLTFRDLGPADQGRIAAFVEMRQPLFFPDADDLV